MRNSDWKSIREAKDRQRAELVALPFDDKLQIAERLHREGIAMRAGIVLQRRESMATTNIQAPENAVVNATGTVLLNLFGASPAWVSAISSPALGIVAAPERDKRTP